MDESLKCGWKYYNHAVIPLTAPHISVDLEALNDGSVWRMREGGGQTIAGKVDK